MNLNPIARLISSQFNIPAGSAEWTAGACARWLLHSETLGFAWTMPSGFDKRWAVGASAAPVVKK